MPEETIHQVLGLVALFVGVWVVGSIFMAALGLDIVSASTSVIAALGNMVPQLHVHHIVRYRTDPAWPGPVWGHQPPRHYSCREDWAVFCGELVRCLPLLTPAQSF